MTLKLSRDKFFTVKVNIDEPINILLEKIPTIPNNGKFVYKGLVYNVASIFTFREIELIKPETLLLVSPARAGNVLL